MKIKCTRWEFDVSGGFCCADFKMHAFDDYGSPEILIRDNVHVVYFRDVAIKYCPFCGKKIELEVEC